MAETTYFNEPDVQVTDAKIVTPWGMYEPQEVQSVGFERSRDLRSGVRRWLFVALGSIVSVCTILILIYLAFGQVPFGIPILALTLLVSGGLLLTGLWFSPTYKVKMSGTFGLVTFDCGNNFAYALRLKKALQTLVNAKETQKADSPGVA